MSMESPRVTVLMGTYNRPDYLRDAIRSIVHQSFKNWELLVMNDGGTDVAYVVNEFHDGRIFYFNDDLNRGKAVRLNFGLKQARGEYIAYLDDDDLWYPNHLEVLSRALDENPEIGAVYSDLYAVQFIKDETNGKRYPLHKFIQVSRDYNREFMFHFNHTLHVSLMHRRSLALRCGGYDETVTVLIDWNITRKLSFFTDFKYIPVVTGEYYMPINKSDRISHLEREDNEKYKHNLRKIKADLPPEPWPKVDSVTVVFPVYQWDEATRNYVTKLVDYLSYPVRFYLVNNDLTKDEAECRNSLDKIGQLKNIAILTPSHTLGNLEAYRFGAQKTRADYLYLPSEKMDFSLPIRLSAPGYYLKKGNCKAIKWNIESEKSGPFDILITRRHFLKQTDSGRNRRETTVKFLSATSVPFAFECDFLTHKAKKELENGNYESALQLLNQAASVQKGGIGDQYLAELYAKICFQLKRYDEAEGKFLELVRRGYGADNWIRLGQIYQSKGRFDEAIDAYRKGLDGIELKDKDLESSVFPVVVPIDFNSHTAYLGLGECLYETGRPGESARMFRKAAKLKANSHRPFLGFCKLFLKSGEMDRAEQALKEAVKRNKKDPKIYSLLGRLCQKKDQLPRAFSSYLKAFELDKTESRNIDSLYKVGAVLEKWEEMMKVFEEFLKHRPGNIPAMSRLSSIYCRLGEYQRAKGLVEQALVLDEKNPELKEIYFKIQQAENQRVAI